MNSVSASCGAAGSNNTTYRQEGTFPRYAIGLLLVIVVSILILYDLGSYALWCDEAGTALLAQGIRRTGDLSAELDHNLFAYRHGAELVNRRSRYLPPLSFYLAALTTSPDSTDSFWPRFPFALCGILATTLLAWWAATSLLPTSSLLLFAWGLASNASWILYSRQCRYFPLANLLVVVIAYAYLHHDGRRRWTIALGLSLCLLVTTQYLTYAAVVVTLFADYLYFGRHERKLSAADWLVLLLPQVLVAGVTLSIFNPFMRNVLHTDAPGSFWMDRLILLGRALRDANATEMILALAFGFGLLAYRWHHSKVLFRASLALAVYMVATACVAPTPVRLESKFDVRYLCSAIPLGVLVTVLAIASLSQGRVLKMLPLGLLAFNTNLLNLPFSPHQWRSTQLELIRELATHRPTASGETAHWLKQNVAPGQSVWVAAPDYALYPLMYHAPHPQYAWQLNDPPPVQFADLPDSHFLGRQPVDYIVAFGPSGLATWDVVEPQLAARGWNYELTARLPIYHDDAIRPELFWRSFQPIDRFDQDRYAVYILRRKR